MLIAPPPVQDLEKPVVKRIDGVGPIDINRCLELFRRCCSPGIQPRPCFSPCDHSFTGAGLAGAIVDHVTTKCEDQGKLLEEAQRDLEVFKRAYYDAEREIQDLAESFEQEKQALNDEIRRLREHELHCRNGRFESNHYPEILLTPSLT